MNYLLLADESTETHDIILSFFKDEFKVLVPSSFNGLIKGPFLKHFLAIVDHSFSGNKGLEVLQAIKKVRPSLPVIFTASEYTEDLCLNIFRLGALDYLKKPFTIEDLVRCIELISQFRYGEKSKMDIRNTLLENYSNKFATHNKLQNIHPRIEIARKYMERNYNKALSLPSLAKVACMDKYHFCKTFKKQTGKTYTEYINILRIEKAKELLLERNTLSITKIALLVGFNDHSYFDRVFTCTEDLSPSAYRMKHLFSQE